jgi:uncharacterized protein
MPLTAKGSKIMSAMKEKYGERGEEIFYRSKNAGTITGVDQGALAFLGTLRNFLRGLLSWAQEEESEEEHNDTGLDRQDAQPPLAPALSSELRAANDMALDRTTPVMALDKNRTYDKDGRLHVTNCNLTKATVNPYLGAEIPGSEQLGLDPKKTYMLLRHPDELAKPETVASFNGQPLLWDHKPVSAQDHPAEITVGATGTQSRFEHPYVVNDVVIWPDFASQAVEDGEKQQISAGYSYDADMTSGVYEGVPYDGVMRNIRANHLSLVRQGRAGPDVMVADSSIDDLRWQALERALVHLEGQSR